MPERYRVRTADGQVFDVHATPAKIRKEHPEGRIEGRIVVDELGQGRVVPYQGEQPEAAEDAAVSNESGPQSGDEPIAAKQPAKSKKSG
jgi:hypothetical protein